MSERAFLARELGIEWRTVSPDELRETLHSPGPHLLIISDPEPYRELLAAGARSSVVIFLISDEEYTQARRELVQHSEAVRAVFRHYSTELASPGAIATALTAFIADCRHSDVRATSAIDLLSRGRASRAAMRAWRTIGIPVVTVPLGYTETFERAFSEKMTAPSHGSLFDSWQSPKTSRATSIAFRGIAGQAQRRAMLQAAGRQPSVLIEILDATWSGSDPSAGTDYVDLLLSTEQALCPPGFVNIESFRRYEALLCGARPITLPTALTHLGAVPGGDWSDVESGIESVRLALASIRQRLSAVMSTS